MLASYTTRSYLSAEERNRTSAVIITNGFTDHRHSIRPPQKRENDEYSVFKQQRSEAPNQKTASEAAPLLNSHYGFFLRFGSGRTAPAGSMHATAIIGEPSFCRF